MPPFPSDSWPSCLPDPHESPHVYVTGLHTWVNEIDNAPVKWAIIGFLLGVNDRTPTNSDYERVFATRDLADASWMGGSHQFARFSAGVHVAGFQGPDNRPPISHPPPPLPGGSPSSSESNDGFCYLSAFKDGVHDRVKTTLGVNPWAPSLAAHLLNNLGDWYDGRVAVSITGYSGGTRRALQMHLKRSSSGVKVGEVLGFLTSHCRVGAAKADIQALLNTQSPDRPPVETPSKYSDVVRMQRIPISVGVYGLLAQDEKKYPPLSFSALQGPVLTAMLGMYESVLIEAASFKISIDKGSANKVWAAITPTSGDLVNEGDWFAAPINTLVQGSDQGAVEVDFNLPPNHAFGKECRNYAFGNPAPSFRFVFRGGATSTARVSGILHFSVGGRANIGHVPLNIYDKKITASRVARIVGVTLERVGRTSLSNDDSDSSSDEEEDDPPQPRTAAKPPPVRSPPASGRA